MKRVTLRNIIIIFLLIVILTIGILYIVLKYKDDNKYEEYFSNASDKKYDIINNEELGSYEIFYDREYLEKNIIYYLKISDKLSYNEAINNMNYTQNFNNNNFSQETYTGIISSVTDINIQFIGIEIEDSTFINNYICKYFLKRNGNLEAGVLKIFIDEYNYIDDIIRVIYY